MTNFNMIDSPQGPDPKRLLLAVVVTSLVLMVYSYFFTPMPEAPGEKSEPTQIAEQSETPKQIPNENVVKQKGFAEATPSNIEQQYFSFSFQEPDSNDKKRLSYRAQIDNYGAVISGFSLTDFSQDKEIFETKSAKSFLPSIKSLNQFVTLDQSSTYELVDRGADFISLKHVTPEGLQVVRNFQFTESGLIDESIEVKNLSKKTLKLEMALGISKEEQDTAEPGMLNPGVQGKRIVFKTNSVFEKLDFKSLLEKPETFSSIQYVALDDQYFITTLIPKSTDKILEASASVVEESDKIKVAKIDLSLKPMILVEGESQKFSHQIFIGPKQVDLLASINPPLDENIDFGWFGVLSRPMLWLLVKIFDFVQNYGLAIILITLIIKLLTFPLTQKSFKSQQEMKVLQPKIKKLQEKYGHDRTLLGQKQMELYKTHGINPLAGCLPLFIQLPIWFAFYQMLRSSVELYDQPFYFWIHDLTLPDAYFVFPVLMGASMLVQQLFTPTQVDQPGMKYVMWGMPIFLTFIMLNMPAGLSLYILTNNLLTILQQVIIKKQAS